jgi:hypothetical protein
VTGSGLNKKCSVPDKSADFSHCHHGHTSYGLHQPYVRLVSMVLSPGVKKLTTHLLLVPKLRLCRALSPLPHTYS